MNTTKNESQTQDNTANQGFIAQPRVFLSRDGEYLIHLVPGGMIRKSVNYYKKILGIEFVPKAQRAAVKATV